MKVYLTESQLAAIILEAMNVQDIYHTYYSDIDQSLYNKVVQADPTFDGQKMGRYTKWLLGLVRRGKLNEGDLNEAKKFLAVFDKYRNKVDVKDVTQLKSMRDLYDVVKPFMQGNISTSKSEEIRNIKEGAEKAYEDDTWLVVIPHTEEAAKLYGKGTKWCTAANNDNMFESYNEEGPLYININKKTGEKFQFHFEDEQFMNELNEKIKQPIIENIGMTDGLVDFYAKILGSKNCAVIYFKYGTPALIEGTNDYYVSENHDDSNNSMDSIVKGTELVYSLYAQGESAHTVWSRERNCLYVASVNGRYIPVYGKGFNFLDVVTLKHLLPKMKAASCDLYPYSSKYLESYNNVRSFEWRDDGGNVYEYTFSDGKSRLRKQYSDDGRTVFDKEGNLTGNRK